MKSYQRIATGLLSACLVLMLLACPSGTKDAPAKSKAKAAAVAFKFDKASVTGLTVFGGGKLTIPAKHGDVKITKIAKNAFKRLADTKTGTITELVLPWGIESIGANAFEGNKIVAITLPSSVTTVGMDSFKGNAIKTVTLSSDTAKYKDKLLFTKFGFIKTDKVTLKYPKSETGKPTGDVWAIFGEKVPVSPVFGFTAVTGSTTNVILTGLKEGTTLLGSTLVIEAETGKTITEIKADAFKDLGIATVKFPTLGLTKIGANAFKDNKLTELDIPASVTTIGEGAFSTRQKDSAYTGFDLKVPATVTSLGKNAFNEAGLKVLTFTGTSKLATIPEGVFAGNMLATVAIPASVTAIDKNAFKSNKLTAFSEAGKVATIAEGAFSTNVIAKLPSTLTALKSIGKDAFKANKLTALSIPASVTTISEGAFSARQEDSAYAGFDLTLPANVTTIGKEAFNKAGLKKLTITAAANGAAKKLTTISEGAFASNKLTEITLPTNVKNIGKEAFNANSTLTTIHFPVALMTADIASDAFKGIVSTTFVNLQLTEVNAGYSVAANFIAFRDKLKMTKAECIITTLVSTQAVPSSNSLRTAWDSVCTKTPVAGP